MNRCKETQVSTDLQMHISKSFFLNQKRIPAVISNTMNPKSLFSLFAL